MRIAVSVENDRIHPSFSETRLFRLYEAEGQRIVRELTVPSLGEDTAALTAALRDYRANALICGSVDGRTRAALEESGVLVFGGVIGRPEDAVIALLEGTLSAAPTECSGEACRSCTAGCKTSRKTN